MLVFYVLSVFLIVAIMPWNSAELGKSPFATTLDEIGIPAAAQVMNVIVLTAVLSCLNSGLYVASRMNFALARAATRRSGWCGSTAAACRRGRS